ncbi:MAG: hypothetical protein JSR54_04620 [Proteobacteria bacterium]|nr:hypothetical protein [Pseudomonadota bacterium]
MNSLLIVVSLGSVIALAEPPEPAHSHPAPEKLGTVHFETSCARAARAPFDHAVALLHSFAYDAAEREFRAIAVQDPDCAMAHWGAALSVYHQMWSPPGAQALRTGREEVQAAQRLAAGSERERLFIAATAAYFAGTAPADPAARALGYEHAMATLAARFPEDDEAQVFYALALLSTAPPTDRTHANQKRAAALLEPIYRRQPDHPGVAHYLIHAYDSTELAPRGLAAARAYATIAPGAPHALHMPSHIFTRLGLWDDSIASNEAARRAAREQHDVGEELHAMDYLTYAFLQRGRVTDAERVVQQLQSMGDLLDGDFKVGYASTAMPVRLAVEGERWAVASTLAPLPGTAPHVAAISHWARALGHAHLGQPELARADIAAIEACESRTRAAGNDYWARQVGVLAGEARAWTARAAGRPAEALALMREAADAEDALEKLPVTPGPIVPAREQLGRLLLDLHRPAEALVELKRALLEAPNRRAALEAAATAAEQSGDGAAAARFREQLTAI